MTWSFRRRRGVEEEDRKNRPNNWIVNQPWERVMSSRTLLLWVAATLNVTAALAQGAAAPTPALKPGEIRISIKNSYYVTLELGALGTGWRKGIDGVVGVLKRQANNEYVGSVTADINALQKMSSPLRKCPEAATKGTQQLKIIGRPVSGFGPFQTITYDRSASTGRETGEFLELRLYPEILTAPQLPVHAPQMSAKDPCLEPLEVAEGIFILPLNDSRWSLSEEGYIIVLPSSGLLVYSDDAIAKKIRRPTALTPPLDAEEGLWTIRVERLPQ